MTMDDALNDLAGELFTAFARFEYALKTPGIFHKGMCGGIRLAFLGGIGLRPL